ncbi:MAG: succinate dehydrogenase/fumarate reductase flavoprotein subunit, partial [Planctomycetota bacterium]
GTFALNEAEDGAPTIDHALEYNKAIESEGLGDRVAPMLLPDYTLGHVKERQLTTNYLGSMR